jgi:flagellar basal-body rod protein FlgG
MARPLRLRRLDKEASMTGGLNVAGRAMSNFAARHDVIANNLANVSTPGFARRDTFVERLSAVDAAPFEGPRIETRVDFTAGPPVLTGNPLDLSLEGSGFFSVATDQGERFSRVASLRTDADGILRTLEGNAVRGENGHLFVDGGLVSVEKDGSVLVDGSFLDRLKITTFASGDDITQESAGLFASKPGHGPNLAMDRPIVHSGQLEGSAVSPVSELVQMIAAMRSYEAASSAVRATDSTIDRAVNDIARI